jgi:hypothetical protein
MNEIKVTVTYEKPITSRIDTLFAEYDVAHNLAEATKAELTPIINEVGEAKHKAILDQLESIVEAVKKLHKLRQQVYGKWNVSSTYVVASYVLNNQKRNFVIKYTEFVNDNPISIQFCNTSLDSMNGFDFVTINREYEWHYFGAYDGIITNWNKLNIIEGLQGSLERSIKDLIQVANRKRDTIQANFNAIMED